MTNDSLIQKLLTGKMREGLSPTLDSWNAAIDMCIKVIQQHEIDQPSEISVIAAIIDNAAFDLAREGNGYGIWKRDASKRRRIALAKAQKIMELFNRPGVEPYISRNS